MTQRLATFACPDCGGPLAREAQRCTRCVPRAHHQRSNSPGQQTGELGLNAGRRESLITFANEARGLSRTLHCFGDGTKAQIADGLRRLDGEGWSVACRSTPLSILKDLRTDTMDDQTLLRRADKFQKDVA
jgi:hypothetical protein